MSFNQIKWILLEWNEYYQVVMQQKGQLSHKTPYSARVAFIRYDLNFSQHPIPTHPKLQLYSLQLEYVLG